MIKYFAKNLKTENKKSAEVFYSKWYGTTTRKEHNPRLNLLIQAVGCFVFLVSECTVSSTVDETLSFIVKCRQSTLQK